MTTLIRSGLLALAFTTCLGLAGATPTASAQSAKEAPAKEPTDGFFDVPARPPGEEAEAWGLPAYLVTSTLGGLGVFIMCKSSRRS